MSETPNPEAAAASTPAAPPVAAPTPTVSTSLAELKATVAAAAGLPEGLASRINGANLNEMMADAKALQAMMPKPAPAPVSTPAPLTPAAETLATEAEPRESTTPVIRREQNAGSMTREQIALLAKKSPRRFNEMLESGQINLQSVIR